ncbi:NAD(P)/FAD-dependent oxidoreductase [Actinomadura harenae]|uniref:NAD(P)/FAD-dependent oxidoreductase n=1 Tax=Actinomadura harenae TaxID=2483351 RepID=A0A3M2LU13_9ACTN|nr:NAD(P)/FAD-dependent oxidoreductase [Actinomadura harenae]RMI40964.1 NAD(P)/FAD-dependent oxidoreductase [Actinomadura harenae]
MNENMHDVVVIGGGAAGLSAGLVLARARRRITILDGGAPRNAPAAHMHGFLSRDGMPPAALLEAGRAELAGYGVEPITARVDEVAREDGPEPAFTVRLTGGASLRARRILVATGLRDELPDLPGLRERWGKDVLHCPYCHGYEVRDRPIGVLATGPMAVHQTLLVRQWSSDVVLFGQGREISPEDRERLAARGVTIREGQVKRVVADDDGLRGVELADGRVVDRGALFVQSTMIPNDGLLTGLGCAREDGLVRTDGKGRTAVPGVSAAGNVVNPHAQVIMAAAEGSAAAMALNADLVEGDVQRAVRHDRVTGRRATEFGGAVEAMIAEAVLGDRRHGL